MYVMNQQHGQALDHALNIRQNGHLTKTLENVYFSPMEDVVQLETCSTARKSA